MTTDAALHRTPLHDLHLKLGGKMVPFAGYEMPVQYPAGIIKEHLHCRSAAALFDVSHMGQAFVIGPDGDAVIESLTPGNIKGLAPGRMRYTQLLNDSGGILDDLMVTRVEQLEGHLFLVVNAARKESDLDRIGSAAVKAGCTLKPLDGRALIALQGPAAAVILDRLCPGIAELKFMGARWTQVAGVDAYVSRCGYTGEDGYELSVAGGDAESLASELLANPDVMPAGLGARDTLRLESGLCLYGHDIDEATTPVEADLAWSIGKRRREEGGFPGAGRVLAELADGPARKRIGLRIDGRAPAREGASITDQDGETIGRVTSGGYAPSLQAPIAMGYVDAAHAVVGQTVRVLVRDKPIEADIVTMPFVEQRYYRG